MINPRGDRRGGRIGLLGGSFNPAHAGHRSIAELARRRLRLDAVWLLVSPGNPLKPAAGMAPLAARLLSARALADGRRIVASAVEAALGTRYTADTLRRLRRRFPRAQFVWLMGADNLEQLPRWRGWRTIACTMPFAVFPAPRTIIAHSPVSRPAGCAGGDGLDALLRPWRGWRPRPGSS